MLGAFPLVLLYNYTCSCVGGDGCVVGPHPQISCGDDGGDGGVAAGLSPCAQTLWIGHHLHRDLAYKGDLSLK